MSRHRLALIPASYIYLRRGGEVLLQQRQNTGYMDGHWVAGAAGHIEAGETARAAAVREAREELGVAIAREHLTLITVMQRTDGSADLREQRVDWFWTATRWEGVPRIMEPDKASRIEWHSLAALPAPIPAYERAVLNGLRDDDLPLDTAMGFPPDIPA
ncbi:NUDIX domain-containing protein [Microbacterium gorillae]|uniref:NUDIX domain-containing protein n=1 Tax=Microbacterium gorillae TaxID=1231063 RepID=UPI003D95BCA3